MLVAVLLTRDRRWRGTCRVLGARYTTALPMARTARRRPPRLSSAPPRRRTSPTTALVPAARPPSTTRVTHACPATLACATDRRTSRPCLGRRAHWGPP